MLLKHDREKRIGCQSRVAWPANQGGGSTISNRARFAWCRRGRRPPPSRSAAAVWGRDANELFLNALEHFGIRHVDTGAVFRRVLWIMELSQSSVRRIQAPLLREVGRVESTDVWTDRMDDLN
jgi:hypothetical protein